MVNPINKELISFIGRAIRFILFHIDLIIAQFFEKMVNVFLSMLAERTISMLAEL